MTQTWSASVEKDTKSSVQMSRKLQNREITSHETVKNAL